MIISFSSRHNLHFCEPVLFWWTCLIVDHLVLKFRLLSFLHDQSFRCCNVCLTKWFCVVAVSGFEVVGCYADVRASLVVVSRCCLSFVDYVRLEAVPLVWAFGRLSDDQLDQLSIINVFENWRYWSFTVNAKLFWNMKWYNFPNEVTNFPKILIL